MRKAGMRIRKKIRSLIDDCHRKLIKWLVTNYRIILIPEFETPKMVNKKCRNIGSKTARSMCTWSHYRFRTRLEQKTREYPWCQVIYVKEDYTSKTCGDCGAIHWKLGKNKVFKCPECRIVMDRDVN